MFTEFKIIGKNSNYDDNVLEFSVCLTIDSKKLYQTLTVYREELLTKNLLRIFFERFADQFSQGVADEIM
jgi:hypothetical protein